MRGKKKIMEWKEVRRSELKENRRKKEKKDKDKWREKK